ncbi:hypothetical protein NDU88_001748 [Pleurodeles waltl]|uniref:Uncharacterized protein n=1 Tax=Pleurodeles waltl TaxID=8319 RepID=A0AAV7MLU2_PLEWA|nr:hypothetical protein NDU88_001748 [Pleurodeles waltl]
MDPLLCLAPQPAPLLHSNGARVSPSPQDPSSGRLTWSLPTAGGGGFRRSSQSLIRLCSVALASRHSSVAGPPPGPGGPEAKTGSFCRRLPGAAPSAPQPLEPPARVQGPRARRRHPAATNPHAPRPGSPPARATVFSAQGCTGLQCRRLRGRAPFNRRSRRPRRSSRTTRRPS